MSKYKAGDKVVVDIKDTYLSAYGIKCYGLNGIGDYSAERIDEKTEPLSTYTEPLDDKIRRQAAEITRLLEENKELKEQMKFDLPTLISEEDRRRMDINKARAEGAEAAWELARKIYLLQEFGGYSTDELVEIFGTASIGEIFRYTYSEAAAKVSQWEKAKEEIKVGDIVRAENIHGTDGIVTCVDGCNITLMLNNGVAVYRNKNACYKTGRHIDIDNLLKQIGGEKATFG